MEHATEVEDEETPDEYDWQISRLVSTATYMRDQMLAELRQEE